MRQPVLTLGAHFFDGPFEDDVAVDSLVHSVAAALSGINEADGASPWPVWSAVGGNCTRRLAKETAMVSMFDGRMQIWLT